jgi:hypothetical protein
MLVHEAVNVAGEVRNVGALNSALASGEEFHRCSPLIEFVGAGVAGFYFIEAIRRIPFH